jgi:hypothetical protein
MTYLTIKQLQGLKGFLWDDNITSAISGTNVLTWHALEELGSMLELSIPVEQLEDVAPKALQVLEDGRAYFQGLGVPRPHAVELIWLKLERLKAGLDPFGE